MTIKEILKYSRPRFRLYVIGPLLLWYVATISQPIELLSWLFFWRLIYFSLPANLLIYGINDIADYDTDKNNPKKQSYELLLTPDKQKTIRIAIAITNIPFLIRAIYQWRYIMMTVIVFRFLGIFYSSKPIRAKAIPFIDGLFNALYIIPWFLWYFLWWGTRIDLTIVIAGTLRCIAMHAYSAIPDIQSDKQAKLQTTATILGKNGTLVYCLICRTTAGILWYNTIGPISLIVMTIYIILIIVSRKKELFTIYKRFPIINTIVGMTIFFSILLTKPR